MFYIRAEILGNKKYEKKLDSSIIPLEEEDSCFMQEVFKSHRHYETKFASFSQLGVGEFPSKEKKTRCFFVCGGQGKSVDISYLKTVQYLFENLRPEAFLPNNMRRVGLVADLTAKLLQIYPLSRNSLLELLAEGFPHKRRGEGLLELYLFFLLLLCLVQIIIIKKNFVYQ